MELPGSEYLFNLSLLAVTFATVSALVMLVRQTIGGRLSNFDVYLITAYISQGFALAVAAILPPLIALFELPAPIVWAVASGLAAVLLVSVTASVVARRRKASSEPISLGVATTFSLHLVDAALLAANAAVPTLRGAGIFALALTLSLAVVLWAFVRRISSLLGEKPGDDWDPKRG